MRYWSYKMEERDGEMVDIHQKTRDDFFEALTAFAGCLKVALQSATFFTDKSFTEQDRNLYKETVKQMSSLRQWAMQVSGEQVNYDDYAEQVKNCWISMSPALRFVNRMACMKSVKWARAKSPKSGTTIKPAMKPTSLKPV